MSNTFLKTAEFCRILLLVGVAWVYKMRMIRSLDCMLSKLGLEIATSWQPSCLQTLQLSRRHSKVTVAALVFFDADPPKDVDQGNAHDVQPTNANASGCERVFFCAT